MQRRVHRPFGILARAALSGLGLLACGVEVEAVPEGKLALVGDRALGPEDVEATQAQLGAYGQARFRGEHGQRALLEAKMIESLLEQEAVDAGLADDPRVHWALIEEWATLALATELERRFPREAIAADTVTLRAAYEASPDAFRVPERRSLRAVRFREVRAAEAALAALRSGSAALEDYGQVATTPLAERDDAGFPGFHAHLFDPALGEGDWLAVPVLSTRGLLVGKVHQLEPSRLRPFDDPQVQQQLVDTVRARRESALREQILAELAKRFPEQPS